MGSTNSQKPQKIQSILALPSNFKRITCPTCDMTYNPHIPQDKLLHNKYHTNFINGIPWNYKTDDDVSIIENFTLVEKQSLNPTGKLKLTRTRLTVKGSIICINKSNKRHLLKVELLLNIVNQELNASQDSGQWKKLEFDKSKAFVIIIDNKAIGLCTTDTIQPDQGRWMIHKTQSIVPNQINRKVVIGISRIWISLKWRQYGLGKKLLDVVLKNSIYSVQLSKNQVAFSQPSFSGGMLAKSFNGVKHKSGEMLLPVYIE